MGKIHRKQISEISCIVSHGVESCKGMETKDSSIFCGVVSEGLSIEVIFEQEWKLWEGVRHRKKREKSF